MSKMDQFSALHVAGDPLILINIWDAGSAKAVAAAGAKAIATGSWSVAAAHGFADGEVLPLDTVMASTREIVEAVELPVSVDFERGYGADAGAVGENCAALAATGIIGINLEDGNAPLAEAAARVAAACSTGLFVNARTDLFMKSDPGHHNRAMLDEALERARAYADAGAGCFFAPFLNDERLIAQLCEQSPLPVNMMRLGDRFSIRRLAELGVARISHGPAPYRALMAALEADAREAFAAR